MDNEPENEITITVFRLLVLDLLALFQVLNHALINILGKDWQTIYIVCCGFADRMRQATSSRCPNPMRNELWKCTAVSPGRPTRWSNT